MAVEFYPTCRNSLSVVRFPTKPELARRKETKAVSIQTEVVLEDTSASIIDASTPNNSSRYVAAPSKKGRQDNVNLCKICNITYGSKMDDKYGSMWINCSTRSCNYWVHLFCLRFTCKDEDKQNFEKIVDYHCKPHNLHRISRPRSISKKL